MYVFMWCRARVKFIKECRRITNPAERGETKKTDAKVTIIEQKGKSDGNNPLGVKNE